MSTASKHHAALADLYDRIGELDTPYADLDAPARIELLSREMASRRPLHGRGSPRRGRRGIRLPLAHDGDQAGSGHLRSRGSSILPFSLPDLSRAMAPPGGTGVAALMPNLDSAAELRMRLWPPRTRATGTSGATPSSSCAVGRRCSASCASCQSGLETMIAPGAAARAALATLARISAIERALREIETLARPLAMEIGRAEPRYNKGAMQVDRPAPRPRNRLGPARDADRDEPVAANREGGRHSIARGRGENPGVVVDGHRRVGGGAPALAAPPPEKNQDAGAEKPLSRAIPRWRTRFGRCKHAAQSSRCGPVAAYGGEIKGVGRVPTPMPTSQWPPLNL